MRFKTLVAACAIVMAIAAPPTMAGDRIEVGGPFIPEEADLFGVLHVDQAHGVAKRFPGDPNRGPGVITESQFLPVATGAGHGVVHRQRLVVKQHPPQGCPRVGDRLTAAVVLPHVTRYGMVGVVRQVLEIDGLAKGRFDR